MAKREPPLFQRRVLRLLLAADLDSIQAADVAAALHISASTLRRRLRREQTSYQLLLDRVRRHRCQQVLARRWLPGKCLASSLGFSQPNSFYRAFGKWTGMSYTQYKKQLRAGSARGAQQLY
jgi:AraC-like DNA-binding protein